MTEKIVAFDKIKPARLLAMKEEVTRLDSVHIEVNTMKASEKIVFSFINASAGDQKLIPVTKIIAITMPSNPPRVKQEFINPCGFSA